MFWYADIQIASSYEKKKEITQCLKSISNWLHEQVFFFMKKTNLNLLSQELLYFAHFFKLRSAPKNIRWCLVSNFTDRNSPQNFKTELGKTLENQIFVWCGIKDEKHHGPHSFEDLRPSPKTVKDEILSLMKKNSSNITS